MHHSTLDNPFSSNKVHFGCFGIPFIVHTNTFTFFIATNNKSNAYSPDEYSMCYCTYLNIKVLKYKQFLLVILVWEVLLDEDTCPVLLVAIMSNGLYGSPASDLTAWCFYLFAWLWPVCFCRLLLCAVKKASLRRKVKSIMTPSSLIILTLWDIPMIKCSVITNLNQLQKQKTSTTDLFAFVVYSYCLDVCLVYGDVCCVCFPLSFLFPPLPSYKNAVKIIVVCGLWFSDIYCF